MLYLDIRLNTQRIRSLKMQRKKYNKNYLYDQVIKIKEKYYVKVRAYKVVKGKKIYGSYSKVLKATVK